MKNYKVIISAIIFLILIFGISCNPDIEVNGEYQDIPVVYCVLDQSQEYQYVKVNKTFLGELSAIEMAKISDSLFYKNVEVTLNQYNNSTLVRSWAFEEVDMPKDDGIFANDKNIIYRSQIPFGNINSDSKYELVVNIENGKYVVTGEAYLITGLKVTKPSRSGSYIALANLDNEYEYRFNTVSQGYVYQMIVGFNYLEVNGSDTVYKSFSWPMNQQVIKDNGEMSGRFSVTAFYNQIRSHIPPAENGLQRLVKMPESVTFRLVGVSEDYYTYMQVSQPSSGIVQYNPEFSNVVGGRGLFTSRTSSEVIHTTFNSKTLDFINRDEYISDLGFVPYNNDYYKPYYNISQ